MDETTIIIRNVLNTDYTGREEMRARRIYRNLAILELCCYLLDEDFEQFVNELKIGARLIHENLGTYYD